MTLTKFMSHQCELALRGVETKFTPTAFWRSQPVRNQLV